MAFMLLIILNSRWVLSFLTPSLHPWTISLYSSWILLLPLTCFLFISKFNQEILVHQAGLLLLLFDFLVVKMDHWVLRRWSLNSNQVFCILFFFFFPRASSHGIFPSRPLNRPKYVLLRSNLVVQFFCLTPSSQDPEHHHAIFTAA